jgi:hypothetical protein
VGRRRLKLPLIVFAVDRIEGSKNPETCALYARMSRRRFINRVNVGLPSERQLPAPDSTAGIIVSWGAKFDVLIHIAI